MKEIHIFGDMNCNMHKKNALSSLINDICSTLGASQIIESSTRETSHSSTLIDLIITTAENSIKDSGVIRTSISDHYMTYAIRKGKNFRSSPRIIHTRSYKKFDETLFSHDLTQEDWSDFYQTRDVNTAANCFTDTFLRVADRHAKKIEIKVKGSTNNVFSDELLALMKERDVAKLKASRSGGAEEWNKYKKLRNRVTNLKNREKRNYLNDSVENAKENPKEMWKKLKEFVPCKNTKVWQPNRIEVDGKEETCNRKIAQTFNEYFANIACKLAEKFTGVRKAIQQANANTTFKFEFVNEAQVQKRIKELKNGKSTGLDGISVKLLKASASSISPHLTHLLNLSLISGKVPDLWKRKRVTPIHKSGSKLLCSNYRPISIQPIPLKILERVIYEQLAAYLKETGILDPYQSGFRRNFSTATAIIDVADFIMDELGKGNYVGAIFLDLAKAFDCVDHPLLLSKLQALGIIENEILWFTSYLDERKQVTLINGCMSEEVLEKPFGVPQGSVLGPLLFLVHINDVTSYVNCKSHLYADDTVLLVADKSAQNIEIKLNTELEKAHRWLTENRLTLNAKKTKYLIFGHARKTKQLGDISINLSDSKIDQVESFKYLGVHFDQQLNWKKHLKETAQKISLKLKKIQRASPFLSKHCRTLLVNSLIMPYFDYCSEAWSSASFTSLRRLSNLYNKALKMKEKSPKDPASLQERFKRNTAIMMFKCLNGLAPDYLADRFTCSAQVHQKNTRSAAAKKVHVKNARGKASSSFRRRGTKVWNDLPGTITSKNSILQFKTSLLSL